MSHQIPPDQFSLGIDDVKIAADRLKGHIIQTRQRQAITLSDITGCRLYLKFENRQFTGSFKERGALNKLSCLSVKERARGVIAMSAGNHAQGLAYHAARLKIPATIVMPTPTPIVKVKYTKSHGARVLLHGDTLAKASSFSREMAEREKLCFIHPYDDPLVMAGQGTIALEMLEDIPDLDYLVVPVGGGGLISGMAIAAKAVKPDIQVIGVQSSLYPAMKDAIEGRTVSGSGSSLAEGIAVKYPGEQAKKIVRSLVNDILLVDEADIEYAISMLAMVEKTITEGAGAAGVAAVIRHKDCFRGKKVGTVLCGGNIDQRLLASVLLRDLVRQGRLARLRIALQDRAGELARVAGLIGDKGGNIVDVVHQRVFSQVSAKDTLIEVEIETRDDVQMDQIVTALNKHGYKVDRLEWN